MGKLRLFLWVMFLLPGLASAQKRVSDTTIKMYLIGAQGGLQMPAADMADRFGFNANIGPALYMKAPSNWIFGLTCDFLFGSANQVKESPLDSIAAENGYIINGNGEYQILKTQMRGTLPMFRIGKVMGGPGPNPNSGFMVMGGFGYLIHKINYYWVGSAPPQLAGDYIKGYDRLTAGPAISESIGYLFLNNRNTVNFSVSFEAIQGFTNSYRSFNFDERRAPTERRLDMLFGLKLAWYFPIYKKPSDDTFYF